MISGVKGIFIATLFVVLALKGWCVEFENDAFESAKEIIAELKQNVRPVSIDETMKEAADALKLMVTPVLNRSDPRIQFIAEKIKTDGRLEKKFLRVVHDFKNVVETLPDEAIQFIVKHHGLKGLFNELVQGQTGNTVSRVKRSDETRSGNNVTRTRRVKLESIIHEGVRQGVGGFQRNLFRSFPEIINKITKSGVNAVVSGSLEKLSSSDGNIVNV